MRTIREGETILNDFKAVPFVKGNMYKGRSFEGETDLKHTICKGKMDKVGHLRVKQF